MKTLRIFHVLPALLFALVLGGGGLFVLSGCDAVADAVGVDEVEVDLGAAGNSIPVVAGEPQAQTTDLDRGGAELPDVFDVESITISEDNVSYEPSGVLSKSGSVDSGTIDAFLIIERAPAIGTQVSIVDDAVDDINPSQIDIGNYNGSRFDNCLDQFPPDERPSLRGDYEELSSAEISDIVSDALRQTTFQVTAMVCTDGDISGFLSIDDVVINLDF